MGFTQRGGLFTQHFLDRDLQSIKTDLTVLKNEESQLEGAYRLVLPFKIIPFFGSYVADGEHVVKSTRYGIEVHEIMINALEPYADVIGFSGGSNSSASHLLTAWIFW